MRLVYPTDEGIGYLSKRGAHFGKAKFYTVITLEDGSIKDVQVIPNPGHSGGACSNAVTNILGLNPDALIVGGIGERPALGFSQAGLDVFVDRASSTVQESIKQFLENKLEKLDGRGTCSAH